jgi:hypothetical protein
MNEKATLLLKWKPRPHQLVSISRTMCVECYVFSNQIYVCAPPLPPSGINLQNFKLKLRLIVEKTNETWCLLFMEANQLAAAGFYFIKQSDVVRSDFCVVEVGHWDEGEVALKDHQRWSPSCGFLKELCVGNIPILSNDQPEKSSDQPTRSRDFCLGRFELRKISFPERSKCYYLYFAFWYVCVFDNTVINFNFVLQLHVLQFLNTLKDKTIVANGTAPSTLNSEDSPPECSLYPYGLLRPIKTLTI